MIWATRRSCGALDGNGRSDDPRQRGALPGRHERPRPGFIGPLGHDGARRSGSVTGMAAQQASGEVPAVTRFAIDQLCFDRRNPRLFLDGELDESDLVERLWKEFAVDELALSIASNGYFEHEPLFVAPENGKLVVVEGNRRLAAVRILVDGTLRAKVGAGDLPTITSARRKELATLPAIECEATEHMAVRRL